MSTILVMACAVVPLLQNTWERSKYAASCWYFSNTSDAHWGSAQCTEDEIEIFPEHEDLCDPLRTVQQCQKCGRWWRWPPTKMFFFWRLVVFSDPGGKHAWIYGTWQTQKKTKYSSYLQCSLNNIGADIFVLAIIKSGCATETIPFGSLKALKSKWHRPISIGLQGKAHRGCWARRMITWVTYFWHRIWRMKTWGNAVEFDENMQVELRRMEGGW